LKVIWLILGFSFSLFSQTDWQRWQKAETKYSHELEPPERTYSVEGGNPFELLLKASAVTYWFFISDVDGDNCPFDPSCSSFFLESVKASNIIEGTLMFFDRFLRDFNVFNRNDYAISPKRRLLDPPEKYLLTTVRSKAK